MQQLFIDSQVHHVLSMTKVSECIGPNPCGFVPISETLKSIGSRETKRVSKM